MTEKTDAGSIILLVDDRNETSALMKELLEEGRYRVLTAADEADATVRVRVERPNLILLNLHRPPLDAIEAGCRVREGLIDGQAVPVVVIPTETLEVKGHNIDLGRNVYVSFLSAFKQLEILLRRLLQEEKTRGGLI